MSSKSSYDSYRASSIMCQWRWLGSQALSRADAKAWAEYHTADTSLGSSA